MGPAVGPFSSAMVHFHLHLANIEIRSVYSKNTRYLKKSLFIFYVQS